MASGIYKITDKRNGKIYIGRASNLKTRLWRHQCFIHPEDYTEKSLGREKTMEIHKAMAESHNPDDFLFEIIEECQPELLDEREIYYIDKFNCKYPLGYNKTYGGQTHAYKQGEEHYNHKITQEEANRIKQLLKEGNTTQEIISQIPNATCGIISTINSGRCWKDNNENYPLSKLNGVITINEQDVIDMRVLRSQGYNVKEISEIYNLSSSTVSSITIGTSRKDVEGPLAVAKNRNQLSQEQVETLRKYYAENNISIKSLWENFCKDNPVIQIGYDGFKQMIEGKAYKNYKMFKRKDFTKERNDKIKELAKTGLYSKKEIGLLTNCSERTVYRVLNMK